MGKMKQDVIDLTYLGLRRCFRVAERAGLHITGYITFSQASFEATYSEESRTYAVSSDNKAYWSRTGSHSIFGSSLDGSDQHVRLDYLMASEFGGPDGWQIERCWLPKADYERIQHLVRAEWERRRDGEAR